MICLLCCMWWLDNFYLIVFDSDSVGLLWLPKQKIVHFYFIRTSKFDSRLYVLTSKPCFSLKILLFCSCHSHNRRAVSRRQTVQTIMWTQRCDVKDVTSKMWRQRCDVKDVKSKIRCYRQLIPFTFRRYSSEDYNLVEE